MRLEMKNILLILLIFMTACSPKESSRKRVMNDGNFLEENQEVNLRNSDLVDSLSSLVLSTSSILNNELQKSEDDRNLERLYEQVIIPISQLIFDEENILNPDFRNVFGSDGRKLSYQLVNILNRSIILIYQKKPSLITEKSLLTDYKNTILIDCQADNPLSSCKLIPFFRAADSANTATIMHYIYQTEQDSMAKGHLIRVISELQNNRLDSKLHTIFVEYIFQGLNLESQGRLTSHRRRSDINLVNTVMKLNIDHLADQSSYVDMLSTLKPWLTLSRQSGGIISDSLTENLTIAARHFLYADNTKQNLSASMIEAINDLKYIIRSESELGVEFQKSNIRGEWKNREESSSGFSLESIFGSTENNDVEQKIAEQLKENPQVLLFGNENANIIPLMLDSSGVRFRFDEYFFLVHQIFYQHYYPADADSVWNNSTKNATRLVEAAKNLLKMQLIYNIVSTNIRMNNFFESQSSASLSSLLEQIGNEVTSISLSWENVNQRALGLLNFINRVIPDSNRELREDRQEFKSIVESIQLNIKYFASYATMYPFLTIITKEELSDNFAFGEIDHTLLVKSFFNGNQRAFFPFGGDTVRLNSVELPITFYYTIIGQTLNSYKENKEVQFDIKEFFKIVVEKFIEEDKKSMKTSLNALKRIEREYRSRTEDFQAMCKQELILQEKEKKNLRDAALVSDDFNYIIDYVKSLEPRQNLTLDVDFLNLGVQSAIYPPNSSEIDKSAASYASSIYQTSIKTTFENFQKKFKLTSARVKMLKDIYVNYASNDDEGLQEKAEIEEEINRQFTDFNALKNEYTAILFAARDQLRVDGVSCSLLFTKRDRSIRYALFFKEAQFLGKLYDKIQPILSGLTYQQRTNLNSSMQENLQQEVETLFGYAKDNEELPQGYRDTSGYYTINGSEIKFFISDYYARLVSYLDQDSFSGNFHISYPPQFENLERGLFKRTRSWTIPFNVNERSKDRQRQAFINAGLLQFAKVFSWMEDAPLLDNLKSEGDVTVLLYKLGSLPINEEVECQENPDDESCRQVSARELITYFKDYIDYLHFDFLDQYVFGKLERPRKYPSSEYELIIKNESGDDLYSYFDLIFKKIYSDGHVNRNGDLWFDSEFNRYTDTIDNLEKNTFIFPYDKDGLYELTERDHKLWISDYFKSIHSFLKETKEIAPSVHESVLTYESGETFSIGRSSLGSYAISPVLSSSQFDRFEDFIKEKNRNFKFYYSDEFEQEMDNLKELIFGEVN